jgi:hypothetical protein
MCFSASASFTAGAVLSIIGVATITKAKHPSHLLFASIPLLFGIQQIAEGFLWVTLPINEYEQIQNLFTYIFLFFAQTLWPIWVPFSILLLTPKISRKFSAKVLVACGFVLGVFLFCFLLNFDVSAKIVEQHIVYYQDYPPSFRVVGVILYMLATIIPPFFSKIKYMWLLGTTILISYIITAIFYNHYLLSVWCFFSSVISLSIYLIIVEIGKKSKKDVLVHAES